MAARVRKLTKEELAELKALPRNAEKRLTGGTYPLPRLDNANPFALPNYLNLWVAENGRLLSCELLRLGETKDAGQTALIDALLAILTPSSKAAPSLPGSIVVNQAYLVEALDHLLAPLKVPVVLESQPLSLFTHLTDIIGADPLPPAFEPFSSEVVEQPELLSDLFRAINGLVKYYPPEAVSARWLIEIKTGSIESLVASETFYASLRERYERPAGIVFYPSLESFEQDTANWDEPPSPSNAELEQTLARLTDLHPNFGQLFLPDELALITQRLKTKDQPIHYIDSLKLYFDHADEMKPEYLKWLSAHKLRNVSRQTIPVVVRQNTDGSQSLLNAIEVRALTNALAGLSYFFRFEGYFFGPHRADWKVQNYPVKLRGGKPLYSGEDSNATAWAEVTYPATGMTIEDEPEIESNSSDAREKRLFDKLTEPLTIERNPVTGMLEILSEEVVVEPDTPPSPLGPRLLYILQVRLAWLPKVWRRIELRGDQTLLDLHYIIQKAFGWDDDHLYSFFLSGQRWDHRSEYSSPWAEDGRNVALYRLESLHLRPGQEFLYLFDYGDSLEHFVKVESVRLGGVQPRRSYPRITEREGKNIPQYRDWSDEDEETEE